MYQLVSYCIAHRLCRLVYASACSALFWLQRHHQHVNPLHQECLKLNRVGRRLIVSILLRDAYYIFLPPQLAWLWQSRCVLSHVSQTHHMLTHARACCICSSYIKETSAQVLYYLIANPITRDAVFRGKGLWTLMQVGHSTTHAQGSSVEVVLTVVVESLPERVR